MTDFHLTKWDLDELPTHLKRPVALRFQKDQGLLVGLIKKLREGYEQKTSQRPWEKSPVVEVLKL